MIDNSKYLPIEEDEREFFNELRTMVTLGWERAPVFESMLTTWMMAHVMSMTRAQLIGKLTAVGVEVPRGASGKPAHKVTLAKTFGAHMIGVIGA